MTEADKRRLNDAVIHATIFRQEEPKDDDQSIYYVFERINTGGISPSGQEIRTCIYHGPFAGLLRDLNNDKTWKDVYGPISRRMKEGKKLYARRKHTPEPVFGIVKSVLGFRQFLLRGLDEVRGEWSLVTMAWNMKRIFALNTR